MPSVKKYGKIRIQRNNWENFQISHRRAAVGVINGARELLVGTEEQPALLNLDRRETEVCRAINILSLHRFA